MANRLYIVPAIGTGTVTDRRRPKYIADQGFTWGGMDYGAQPIFLVGANLTPAQDAAIVANADVTAFPFDLTTNVGGGGVQDARAALEAALIPAQFVNGAMSWNQVARTVAGMFQFMQRLAFYLNNEVILESTDHLNVQWQNVPARIQQGILDTAQSLGYDASFISPTTQVRALIENFSNQWGDKGFSVGPIGL